LFSVFITSYSIAGLSVAEILRITDDQVESDFSKYDRNQRWGGVYHTVALHEETDIERLQTELFKRYNSTNALYPSIFPSVSHFLIVSSSSVICF
jgi:hypothetical protein